MRKFILMMLISIMTFGFSSCVSSQSIYEDYQKVYFDHVIYGRVISDNYVYDGTYSYHIINIVPKNRYWELYPCDVNVYLYTKQMVRMRLFEWNRRSIYYNRTHHNYYRFDDRHLPPRRNYRQPNIRYNKNHNPYRR